MNSAILFLALIGGALADFNCFCNYNVEWTIYSAPDDTSSQLGYLYEFDCKPTYAHGVVKSLWQAIQFEKKVYHL